MKTLLVDDNQHVKAGDLLVEIDPADYHVRLNEASSDARSEKAKIEEAEAKKELLIARSRSAKAQEQMHRTLTGIQGVGSLGEFERMERRVEEQEARAPCDSSR